MFTRDTSSLPSRDFEFHSLQSFQSERCQCQLHRERETNQKRINYYTSTKIYILSRYDICYAQHYHYIDRSFN